MDAGAAAAELVSEEGRNRARGCCAGAAAPACCSRPALFSRGSSSFFYEEEAGAGQRRRSREGDLLQGTGWWRTCSLSNVGFTRAWATSSSLVCADCEVGPIGWHCLDDLRTVSTWLWTGFPGDGGGGGAHPCY